MTPSPLVALLVLSALLSFPSRADTLSSTGKWDNTLELAVSSYLYEGNTGKYNTVSLVDSMGYTYGHDLRMHATVEATGQDALTDVSLKEGTIGWWSEFPRLTSEVTLQVGRLRNSMGGYGYIFLRPSTKIGILAPQSLFNANADTALGSLDGVRGIYSHESGSYIQLTRGKVDARGSQVFLQQQLRLTGDVEGGISTHVEAAYSYDPYVLGVASYEWVFYSPGGESIRRRDGFFGQVTVQEHLFKFNYFTVSTSSSIVGGTSPAGELIDLAYIYELTDTTLLYATRNSIYLKDPTLQQVNPSRNFTVDYSLGVQHYWMRRRLIGKIEIHDITGTSWYSVADNPQGLVPHTNILAIQGVYTF